MGTQRICVTVCNVPATLLGNVVAFFLSAFDKVEEVTQLRAATGTAHGDYVFRMCLNREGFQAIPNIIFCQDRQMMVVVEGRWLHCWHCKQVSHLTKACPLKARPPDPQELLEDTTTATGKKNKEAEWKQVTWRGKTNKEATKPSASSNLATTKETSPAGNKKTPSSLETTPVTSERPAPAPRIRTPTSPKPSPAPRTSPRPAPRKMTPPKNNSSPKTPNSQKTITTATKPTETPMDNSTNLKRRRDSGEGQAKKLCPSQPKDTLTPNNHLNHLNNPLCKNPKPFSSLFPNPHSSLFLTIQKPITRPIHIAPLTFSHHPKHTAELIQSLSR